MKTAATFVLISSALVGCIGGDDLAGSPGKKDAPAQHLRSFELVYEGQKLSWKPSDGDDQGLAGSVDGDVFDINAVLLTLQKREQGILKDDGYAGILWRAPGGELKKGNMACSRGEVVIAIQFPHVGHLVTHTGAVYGGADAMAQPVTAGVECQINVTRADTVGGLVEGTINATLAYVPFQVAPGDANALELKQLTGSFKLTRGEDE